MSNGESSQSDKNALPWERTDTDTPRAAKIMRDYFEKEAISADDTERDLYEPMQKLERELAEAKQRVIDAGWGTRLAEQELESSSAERAIPQEDRQEFGPNGFPRVDIPGLLLNLDTLVERGDSTAEVCARGIRQLERELSEERESLAVANEEKQHLLRKLENSMEGHDKPCYYCGAPCNSLTGNPGRWPIPLCHRDEPDAVKWHHIDCVTERLIENQAASSSEHGIFASTHRDSEGVERCDMTGVAVPSHEPALVERLRLKLLDLCDRIEWKGVSRESNLEITVREARALAKAAASAKRGRDG